MRSLVATVVLLAFGAGCGGRSTRPSVDAGPDGAVDAGPTGCEGFVPDGSRACVPRGLFWFGWIVDEVTCPSCTSEQLEMRAATHDASGNLARELWTDAFLVDLREVSIGEYAELLSESGSTAPPVHCEHPEVRCREDLFTGWSEEGEPPADRLEQPVTCVTTEEAAAFCAARGGRLPLSTEWMKAARGASPSRREFPWVDGIAATWDLGRPGEETHRMLLERVAVWFREGCGDEFNPFQVAEPEPVWTRPENASPYGLLHVLGNASEWVEAVRTDDWYATANTFGSNFSGGLTAVLGSGPLQISTPGGLLPDDDEEPSTVRDRALGFRCAYDLP